MSRLGSSSLGQSMGTNNGAKEKDGCNSSPKQQPLVALSCVSSRCLVRPRSPEMEPRAKKSGRGSSQQWPQAAANRYSILGLILSSGSFLGTENGIQAAFQKTPHRSVCGTTSHSRSNTIAFSPAMQHHGRVRFRAAAWKASASLRDA